MTATTQPNPQVVAWMRGERSTLIKRGEEEHVARVRTIKAYRNAHPDSPHGLRDLVDAYAVAARAPRTVADIPAGQGPASLYVAPFVGDLRAVYFKAEDRRIARVTEENRMRHEMRVLWDHLAATLPHVTTEED